MAPSRDRPWHFWPVCAAGGLFWLVNAADYLLTQVRAPFYLALFSDEQVAYFTALPAEFTTIWAAGVWAGCLGIVLMATGGRRSALALAFGAAGMVAVAAWLVLISEPPMRSVTGFVGDLLVIAGAFLAVIFWLYARVLHGRGVVA
jgi:hypothetical protein